LTYPFQSIHMPLSVGVITFPGSNCDADLRLVLAEQMGCTVHAIWHSDTALPGGVALPGGAFGLDVVFLPGGFSYGDYLRSGAIARFSPIMQAVKAFADGGGRVVGICNGFQILTEAGLLPGALRRNRGTRFICDTVRVKMTSVKSGSTPQALRIPIAHADGNFTASDAALAEMASNGQIFLEYINEHGEASLEANPNGSARNIAGITNRARNVIGLMPHPERAASPLLGNTDGLILLQALLAA
jgi:phosphoribosylformylglycinamidine synthase subunit PurQ / glutaminase